MHLCTPVVDRLCGTPGPHLFRPFGWRGLIPTKTPDCLCHFSGRFSSFCSIFFHVSLTIYGLVALLPYFCLFVVMQSMVSLLFIVASHLLCTSVSVWKRSGLSSF